MDFALPIDLVENFRLDVFSVVLGLYLIALGVIYFLVFHKHHKRNELDFSEMIPLITKFYSITIISTLLIILGIYTILLANSYKDEREEVITHVSLGIIIITATICYYISYIKKSLKDLNQEVRAANKKRTIKIGEILELIFFTIFMLMPLWRIPVFIELWGETKDFLIELARSVGISVAAVLLLVTLNPNDIKGKIKKAFVKKGNNNSIVEYAKEMEEKKNKTKE